MTNNPRQQPYDNLLKRLLENQASSIIPLLLPEGDVTIVEELNIEVLLPPRRTDRVYKAPYKGEMHIFHIEFESSANTKMDKRLLVYHALLLEKHELPIISVIIYPFEVAPVIPPLRESDADGDILNFRYRTLPLWQMDAHRYVERRAIPMYGLLPVMEGISSDLLLNAISEMIEYYGDDEAHLRDELLCFKVLLERAGRLEDEEMQRVERRIRMFDPLLEQDPWVQGLRAQGVAQGELKQAREMMVRFVQRCFPSLTHIAQTKAAEIGQVELLNALSEQLWLAPDESAAREALDGRAAS